MSEIAEAAIWSVRKQLYANWELCMADHAVDLWRRASSSEEYLDVHCWRFVPSSFDLISQDIRQLGLTSFSVEMRFDTAGCELCVVLAKGSGTNSVERLHALETIRVGEL